MTSSTVERTVSFGSGETSYNESDNDTHSIKKVDIVRRRRRRRRRSVTSLSSNNKTPSVREASITNDYYSDEESEWEDDDDITADSDVATDDEPSCFFVQKQGDIWHVRKELPIYAFDTSSVTSRATTEAASDTSSTTIMTLNQRPDSSLDYDYWSDSDSDETSALEEFSQLTELFTRLEDLVGIWHTLALTNPNVEAIKVDRLRAEMNERGWAVHEAEARSSSSVSIAQPGLDIELDDVNLSEERDNLSDQINFYELLGESRKVRLGRSEGTSALENVTTSEKATVSTSPQLPLELGEDTLALEMIEDFLVACSGPILHIIFCNYSSHVPTLYMSKFRHLFYLSMEAQDGLVRALHKPEWQPSAQALPFDNPCWDQDVTCCVCDRNLSAFRRTCCGTHVCEGCLKQYFKIKVEQEGKISIACPNIDCSGVVYKPEIIFRLTAEVKKKFDVFWVNASADRNQKTCPRCSHITKMTPADLKQAQQERKRVWRKKTGLNVTCAECKFVWCFACHCPDHHGLTCRSQRKGEKQLREWAQLWANNQRNARRCPKCKVLTERTEGCPHMDCTKCSTSWCYSCGKKRVKIPLIGGHDSRFSILGCDDNYLASNGHLRRLVRGTIFSLAVIATPPAAVLAIGLGIGLLPFAGIGAATYFIVKAAKRRRRLH